MERYYLSQLLDFPKVGGSSNYMLRKTKFIEIAQDQANGWPTFGVIYFGTRSADGENSPLQRSSQARHAEIGLYLAFLDLSNSETDSSQVSNSARLRIVRQTGPSDTFSWIDFSAEKLVKLRDKSIGRHIIDCVILDTSGHLYGLKLAAKDSKKESACKRLTSGQEAHFKQGDVGRFIMCLVQNFPSSEASENESHAFKVHLLAEKLYISYRLSKSETISAKLSSISQFPAKRIGENFVRVCFVDSNIQLVIIETNQSTWRIVKNSVCLFSINMNGKPTTPISMNLASKRSSCITAISQQSSLSTNENILLLIMVGSKVSAHSIQMGKTESSEEQEDPDNLLVKSPTFEVEDCWSIDLADVTSGLIKDESSFSRIDSEEDANYHKAQYGCMTPLWSLQATSQGSKEREWPRLLCIAYEHHLLVYSFTHQQSAFPFSMTYDNSFLQLSGSPTGKEATDPPIESVDPWTQPILLFNFKLIGTQPGDSLYNHIFLGQRSTSDRSNHISSLEHLSNLNLLVSLTYDGHLICFRLKAKSSSLSGLGHSVEANYLNPIEKRITDALSGASFLKQQINILERLNSALETKYRKLLKNSGVSSESTGGSQKTGSGSNMTMDDLLNVMLKPSEQEFGGLYELKISISSLVNVRKIVVVSMVNAYFLKPTHSANSTLLYDIENDNMASIEGSRNGACAILIPNIDPSKTDKLPHELLANFGKLPQRHQQKFIQSWIIIDLKSDVSSSLDDLMKINGPSSDTISVPIFLMDGQVGQLIVTFTFDFELQMLDEANLQKNLQAKLDKKLNFHSKAIEVKPLFSYKPLNQQLGRDQLDDKNDATWCSLSISGQATGERIVDWLSQCLDDFRPSVAGPFLLEYKSSLTGCRLKVRQAKDNHEPIVLSSDDFMSLELLKRHLLKCATDESVKVGIVEQSNLSTSQLRNLIGLQLRNLTLVTKFLRSMGIRDVALDRDEKLGQIMELLTNEMIDLGNELPLELGPLETIEKALKRDVGELLRSEELNPCNEKTKESSRDKGYLFEVASLLEESILDFIIDALVDFDHIQGKKSTSAAMCKMRSKLTQLIDQHTDNQGILRVTSLIDSILYDWEDLSSLKT